MVIRLCLVTMLALLQNTLVVLRGIHVIVNPIIIPEHFIEPFRGTVKHMNNYGLYNLKSERATASRFRGIPLACFMRKGVVIVMLKRERLKISSYGKHYT